MKTLIVLVMLISASSFADSMKIDCSSVDQILAAQEASFEKVGRDSQETQNNQSVHQVLQQARQMIQQECWNQNGGQQQKPIEN